MNVTRDTSAGEEMLRIGIPSKGRLSEVASQLLNDAGLSFRRSERTLFARCRDMPVEITFLRTDDIPVLTAEGAIDLGVGFCRLALCVPDDSGIDDPRQLADKRIATSFPRVTRQWLAARGVDAHFVDLSGSVEIMIALGVADAIVDLVETGSTLAANRLRVLDEIGRYETVLVQDPHLAHPELADWIVRRLEGIVIARAWSLLEYNVPRRHLAEAEVITPGFNSPTVMALEDSNWCAIRAMVKRGEAHAIIERLEAIGAVAIIETRIANCRL